MPQYPLSGSPPFNPYLPDPRQASTPPQPLGVPQGFPSAPGAPTPASVPQGPQAPLGATPQGPAPQGAVPQAPGQGPRGSALSRFLLGIGDVSAAAQGRPGPSDELRQRRIQDYQLKRQELFQNLELSAKFAEVLTATPVDQLEGRRAKLRDAFGKLAPGQEDLYDLITSDVGLSGATLETLRNNDAVKMILASGGSTRDVLDFVRSEPGQKSVQEMNDRVALPAAKRKIDALRNSTDPRVREALAKGSADKLLTFEEMLAISEEFGTDGPEGTKLTPSEASAVRRNQDQLGLAVPGVIPTSEYLEEKDLERQIRLEREKAAGREAVAQAGKPQNYGARARDQAFAKNVYVPLIAEGGYGEIDRSLSELDAIIPRLEPENKVVSGRVVGRIPKVLRPEESIDIERRVARIVQTDLRRILGGQFAQKEGEDLLARSYDRTLSPELNAKTLNDLRTAVRKEYAAKKAAAAYFEANDGSLEGYSGMKELETGGSVDVPPAKGKPTQADVDRVARERGISDPAQIRAVLRQEGFTF